MLLFYLNGKIGQDVTMKNYAIVPKFYNDAFTEYGLLEDDSYKQINSVTTKMKYIKSKYSTVEFIFEYDDELN